MKNTNRRQFLRTTAGTIISLASVQQIFGGEYSSSYVANMGLQLYTLRNAIAADTPATLKAVAEAGYKQVEAWDFPDCKPMIAAAKDNGLAINSTMFKRSTVLSPSDPELSDFRKILDQANEDGISNLVVPFLEDEYRDSLDAYKRTGRKIKQGRVDFQRSRNSDVLS